MPTAIQLSNPVPQTRPSSSRASRSLPYGPIKKTLPALGDCQKMTPMGELQKPNAPEVNLLVQPDVLSSGV